MSERQLEQQGWIRQALREPGVSEALETWEEVREVWEEIRRIGIREVLYPPTHVLRYATGANSSRPE